MACAVMIVAFFASPYWNVSGHIGPYLAAVSNGAVYVIRFEDWITPFWGVRRNLGGEPYVWWLDYWPPARFSHWCAVIPLWIPLTIVAVPTFLAWRRDRRIPPGHCASCGYDLTGNVSGRCSECGTLVPQQTACGESIARSQEDENK